MRLVEGDGVWLLDSHPLKFNEQVWADVDGRWHHIRFRFQFEPLKWVVLVKEDLDGKERVRSLTEEEAKTISFERFR